MESLKLINFGQILNSDLSRQRRVAVTKSSWGLAGS